MTTYNLGNVVGLLRSEAPPADKPYLIWGKILDPALPLTVQLKIYKGTGDAALEANWRNMLTEDATITINFSDIEGVPEIFDNLTVDVATVTIQARDSDNNVMSSISIHDILNAIPNFTPLEWYTTG